MSWIVASDIAERLRELKDVLGRPYQELAERAGVQPQQFSAWVTEKQKPPKTRLKSWAQRERWPLGIFTEGGRRPAEVIKCVSASAGVAYEHIEPDAPPTPPVTADASVLFPMTDTEFAFYRMGYWAGLRKAADLARSTAPTSGGAAAPVEERFQHLRDDVQASQPPPPNQKESNGE